MVDRNIVKARADRLLEYLGILKSVRRDHTRDECLIDPIVYGSIERFLHLSLEALLDIGNHIIADDRLGKVEHYNDIPKILLEKKLLSAESADTFIKMIGFRNILVHDYLKIDRIIIYDVLTRNLEDIEEILRQYIDYIQ